MNSEIDEKRKRGNSSSIQRIRELHTLWYEMDLIEQVNWLDEAKRTPYKRAQNWAYHIVIATLIIAMVIILSIPHKGTYHYLIAIIGGYITALNYYSITWIIGRIRHK